MARDLLVPPDRETPHGVARFRRHGGLPGELLQHLRCPGEPVARLADGDVCSAIRGGFKGRQGEGQTRSVVDKEGWNGGCESTH